MQIHAERTTLTDLLGVPGRQLRIPPYQRPYAWDADQVDELWDDLTDSLGRGHFMGSIVLTGVDPKRPDVIDGQQRMTTLLLLLALVRDRWRALAEANVGRVQQFLTSAYVKGEDQYKLRTGDANWDVFRRYVLAPPGTPDRREWSAYEGTESAATKLRNAVLFENAQRLGDHIARWLGEVAGDRRVERLDQLELAVLTGLEFVVIRVPDEADAFVIFETLNDRGLALSAGDLLKNALLQDAARERGDLENIADRWDEMLNALQGADVTRFLRHYLLIRHGRVAKDGVFALFKDDVKDKGAVRLVDELVTMARWYGQFVRPQSAEHAETREVLSDLQTLRAVMCYSALLAARANAESIPEAEFVRFARLAEMLTFRYSTICGKDSKELERVYHKAAKRLWDSKGADLEGARREILERMPDADEFRAAFLRKSMGYQYVINYVLRKVEHHLDPEEKVTRGAGPVHIEHILPQTLTPEWTAAIGGRTDEHASFVNRWGNLTLLGGRRNIKASNRPFDAKRLVYATSSIALTKELASRSSWDFDAIEERQRRLADLADLASTPPELQGR